MPNIVDQIAARPLFRVRTFLSIFFGALAWVLATFFGVADANVADWAGADSVVTIGELIVGITGVLAAFFTKNRKPGGVEGIVRPPAG